MTHWAEIALRIAGWRLVGPAPAIRRCVVVFAPHTSNWDFPLLILVRLTCDHALHYLGKSELFAGAFGWFFRMLGGIPVQRQEQQQLVRDSVQRFLDHTDLWLAMSPEGTRARRDHWKTGFYHIALGANVPVLLAFIDAKRRECGFGKLVHLTGDSRRDLATIRDFYASKVGIRPELAGEIRFKDQVAEEHNAAER